MQDTEGLATVLGIGLLGLIGYALVSNSIYQYPAEVAPAKKPAAVPPTGEARKAPAPIISTPITSTTGGLSPTTFGLKGTGKRVAMLKGGAHANGQRYNVNHAFTNYVMMGYFKPGNAEKQNMKTDGPNHGGCSQLPKCTWIEPQVVIASGQMEMGSEWPHPKNHKSPCPSCKSVGSLSGKEYGMAVAAFTEGGFRRCVVWMDATATGKWVKVLDETDKGQITNATLAKRSLPIEGRGLEAELRFHGGSSGTAMRDCNVWEITPPTGALYAQVVQSFFSFLEAKIPRRYNNYL